MAMSIAIEKCSYSFLIREGRNIFTSGLGIFSSIKVNISFN